MQECSLNNNNDKKNENKNNNENNKNSRIYQLMKNLTLQ